MRPILPIMLLLTTLAAAQPAGAAPCTGFKWDISRELALFAAPGAPLAAGNGKTAWPAIIVDRLYDLELLPQSGVRFAMPPGRTSAGESTFAGVVELEVDAPGNYRIAVDAPLWIDVVVNGKLATPSDFQGQQNCDGPHKIVTFDLPGAKQVILQLSGSPKTDVRITVTRSPARTL